MRKDKEGYVPIAIISSFRKMKKLAKDSSLIEAALRTSTILVVSSDGKMVKRMHPLPISEPKDSKLRTILVENLPEDHSEENILRIFGAIGNIEEMTIHDPSSTSKKKDQAISSKLHALIEYDTAEAAKSAVLALNDEKNWRSGMRVELLHKRLEEEHSNGRGRSRNKGKGGGYHHQPNTGKGHGRIHSYLSTEGTINKPILGPRMPDGTKGFTMGRVPTKTAERRNRRRRRAKRKTPMAPSVARPLENGDFEKIPAGGFPSAGMGEGLSTIPGWEANGTVEVVRSGQRQGGMILVVPHAEHAVRLGNEAGVSQSLAVEKGASYAVTFSAARTCAQLESLNVSVTGAASQTVDLQTLYSVEGWDSYAWAFRAGNAAGDGETAKLAFTNPGMEEDPTCGPIIDNIAIKKLFLPDRAEVI
ncbi:hypothetical protein HPP92_009448 [Vanilla planifolia]|uniref:Uncharacterized protein n=1 Tax=Vanilla planifolia TaxID=51239 RepID=A0A835RJB8_VANPL|nr:hypothetical protein HPP92_009448 [Vanilla planifolia]